MTPYTGDDHGPAWNEQGLTYRHCDLCGADDDTASGIRAFPPVPRD